MLADEDNPMEAAPDADPSIAAEPQVVVVYRSRGVPWLLIPPLLLLSAVAAVVAYQRSAKPERRRPAPTVVAIAAPPTPVATPAPIVASPEPIRVDAATIPEPPAAATAPPHVVAPAPAPVAVPLTVEVKPPDEPKVPTRPLAPVEPEPVPNPPAPPIEEARRDPVGFDPDATKAAGATIPGPLAEKRLAPEGIARREPVDSTPPMLARDPVKPPDEDFQADLQRKAEDRIAERAKLDAAGPDLLNPNPRDVWNQRRKLIADSRRQAAMDRLPFLADVRQAIAEGGNNAGPVIQQLCNKYGRDTLPEIHVAMNRDLLGPSSRLSVPGRIQRMRRWGIPETIILDDLVLSELDGLTVRGKGALRGGPRNEGEAWVRAARILIGTPPARPSETTPTTRTANTPANER